MNSENNNNGSKCKAVNDDYRNDNPIEYEFRALAREKTRIHNFLEN